MCTLTASVFFSVKSELVEETKKTVELVDAIEQNSEPLYSVLGPAEGAYLSQQDTLTQKAGYLFLRR